MIESVPGAVATGSQHHAEIESAEIVTRSLPLPVLTSLRDYGDAAAIRTDGDARDSFDSGF